MLVSAELDHMVKDVLQLISKRQNSCCSLGSHLQLITTSLVVSLEVFQKSTAKAVASFLTWTSGGRHRWHASDRHLGMHRRVCGRDAVYSRTVRQLIRIEAARDWAIWQIQQVAMIHVLDGLLLISLVDESRGVWIGIPGIVHVAIQERAFRVLRHAVSRVFEGCLSCW